MLTMGIQRLQYYQLGSGQTKSFLQAGRMLVNGLNYFPQGYEKFPAPLIVYATHHISSSLVLPEMFHSILTLHYLVSYC
jgi:hypothetical protein